MSSIEPLKADDDNVHYFTLCYVCLIFQLLDIMEGMMEKGGNIVDYHGCELFPERWFDAVFVIRTNNTALFDRLTAR